MCWLAFRKSPAPTMRISRSRKCAMSAPTWCPVASASRHRSNFSLKRSPGRKSSTPLEPRCATAEAADSRQASPSAPAKVRRIPEDSTVRAASWKAHCPLDSQLGIIYGAAELLISANAFLVRMRSNATAAATSLASIKAVWNVPSGGPVAEATTAAAHVSSAALVSMPSKHSISALRVRRGSSTNKMANNIAKSVRKGFTKTNRERKTANSAAPAHISRPPTRRGATTAPRDSFRTRLTRAAARNAHSDGTRAKQARFLVINASRGTTPTIEFNAYPVDRANFQARDRTSATTALLDSTWTVIQHQDAIYAHVVSTKTRWVRQVAKFVPSDEPIMNWVNQNVLNALPVNFKSVILLNAQTVQADFSITIWVKRIAHHALEIHIKITKGKRLVWNVLRDSSLRVQTGLEAIMGAWIAKRDNTQALV